MKQKIVIMILASFIYSCDKNDLPKFNKLESLRVIALTTPTPEVSPGDTVTLTPVVSDLQESTGLSDSVVVCLDPGVSYGAEPNCDQNSSRVVVHTNRSLTAPGAGENWTGAGDTFNVTIPASGIIFNGRSAAEQYNGVNYLIDYRLSNSRGETIKSIKRIVVSQASKTKNSNPTMTTIYSNGAVMSALPVNTTTVALSSNLSASSAESYQVQNVDGSTTTRTEQLAVTWFVTDGATKYYRSDVGLSNEYTGPESAPSGRSSYIIAVARDERGGVKVLKLKF